MVLYAKVFFASVILISPFADNLIMYVVVSKIRRNRKICLVFNFPNDDTGERGENKMKANYMYVPVYNIYVCNSFISLITIDVHVLHLLF